MTTRKVQSVKDAPLVHALDSAAQLEFIMRDTRTGDWARYDGADLLALLKNSEAMAELEKQLAELGDTVDKTVDGKLETTTKQLSGLQDAVKSFSTPSVQKTVSKEDIGLGEVANLAPEAIGPNAEGLALARDVHAFVKEQTATVRSNRTNQTLSIGTQAGASVNLGLSKVTAIGDNAQPLSSGSVALGATSQRVHLAQAVATRADARDFDLSDLSIGLDFLLNVNVQEGYQELREDYLDFSDYPVAPLPPGKAPDRPTLAETDPGFQDAWKAYQAQLQPWLTRNTTYSKALGDYQTALAQWQTKTNIALVKKDGTHKQSIKKPIITADALRQAAQKSGLTDAPAVIDHAANGGLDVLSVVNGELTPVIIKAIQDLHALMHSPAYLSQLGQALLEAGRRRTKPAPTT